MCDPATVVRCSNQLSYESTEVGSWSFVDPNKPVRNKCEVIFEICQILNCGCEMKEVKILAVMKAIYAIAYNYGSLQKVGTLMEFETVTQ